MLPRMNCSPIRSIFITNRFTFDLLIGAIFLSIVGWLFDVNFVLIFFLIVVIIQMCKIINIIRKADKMSSEEGRQK